MEWVEWKNGATYSFKNENLNVVAINASYPSETIAHLINYDTTHGTYDKKLKQQKMVLK